MSSRGGGRLSHAAKPPHVCAPGFFSLLSARFVLAAFSSVSPCIAARSTITWTRTHLGTLRSVLRSRVSPTRCPCALNKCENTACAPCSASRRRYRGAPLTLTSREVSCLRLRLRLHDPSPPRFSPVRDLSPVLRLMSMQSRIVLQVSLCNGYQTVTIIEMSRPESTLSIRMKIALERTTIFRVLIIFWRKGFLTVSALQILNMVMVNPIRIVITLINWPNHRGD